MTTLINQIPKYGTTQLISYGQYIFSFLLLCYLGWQYTTSINLPPTTQVEVYLPWVLLAGSILVGWTQQIQAKQVFTYQPPSLPLETLYQSQIDALQKEINTKNQQLALHSLHMMEKNQTLREVQGLVKQLRLQKNMQQARKLIRQLANQVNFGLQLDKDWHRFLEVFEHVHPSFFQHLQAHYPTLTQGELKLCALLQFNLDNKTIASLYGISLNSVLVKRHRLRQKMGLSSKENLHASLSRFTQSAPTVEV